MVLHIARILETQSFSYILRKGLSHHFHHEISTEEVGIDDMMLLEYLRYALPEPTQ